MRNRLIQCLVDENEYKEILAALIKKENETGKRISLSEFTRDALKMYASMDSKSPTIPDIKLDSKQDSSQDSELLVNPGNNGDGNKIENVEHMPNIEMPAKKGFFADLNF